MQHIGLMSQQKNYHINVKAYVGGGGNNSHRMNNIQSPYTLHNSKFAAAKASVGTVGSRGSVISRQMMQPRTTASSIEASRYY